MNDKTIEITDTSIISDTRQLDNNMSVLRDFVSTSQLMVTQQIYNWLKVSIDENKYMFEGKYWVCSTIEQLSKKMHLSVKRIEESISELENIGLLMSRDFNKRELNRTNCYTIDGKVFQEITGVAITPYRNYDFVDNVYQHNPIYFIIEDDGNLTENIRVKKRKPEKRKGNFRFKYTKRGSLDNTISSFILAYIINLHCSITGNKHEPPPTDKLLEYNEKLMTFAFFWLGGLKVASYEFHEEIFANLILMARVFLEDKDVNDHSIGKFVAYKNLEKYLRLVNL